MSMKRTLGISTRTIYFTIKYLQQSQRQRHFRFGRLVFPFAQERHLQVRNAQVIKPKDEGKKLCWKQFLKRIRWFQSANEWRCRQMNDFRQKRLPLKECFGFIRFSHFLRKFYRHYFSHTALILVSHDLQPNAGAASSKWLASQTAWWEHIQELLVRRLWRECFNLGRDNNTSQHLFLDPHC